LSYCGRTEIDTELPEGTLIVEEFIHSITYSDSHRLRVRVTGRPLLQRFEAPLLIVAAWEAVNATKFAPELPKLLAFVFMQVALTNTNSPIYFVVGLSADVKS
jgi:uncharacterized membrane protein YhhN